MRPSEVVLLDLTVAVQKRQRLERLRSTAVLLAVAPTAVAIIFSTVGVTIIKGIRLGLPYSPERTGVLIILLFWAGIASFMWYRFVQLLWLIDALRSKEEGNKADIKIPSR